MKSQSKNIKYLNPFRHIFPDLQEWPIYKLYKQRDKFVSDIDEATFHSYEKLDNQALIELINKTIYQENNRMRRTWKVDPPNEKQFWKKINKSLNQAIAKEDVDFQREMLNEVLRRIIHRYSEEIAGNFKIKTFLFARKFLTVFFGRLFIRSRWGFLPKFWNTRNELKQKLKITGYVEEARKLYKKGVLILVPTHFSNIDSILIGYVIDTMTGLPAFHYGAGLNLYNSEFAAYYMNRLGAYRLDRRKKNPIYMNTLLQMSSVSLQQGINTIFFPGGTRSRSGSLEKKLKLGLLNSSIDAQRTLIQNNQDQRIYIVPVSMSYNFVLEGQELIEQYLKSQGKEKYISSKSKRRLIPYIFKFIRSLYTKSNDISVAFGQPIDVFGNDVNQEGQSIDVKGKTIDLEDYFKVEGKIQKDAQRESVYTRKLGDRILKEFYKSNVVLASHLVAFTAFRMFKEANPDETTFTLLKFKSETLQLPYETFKTNLYAVLHQLFLLNDADEVQLDTVLHGTLEEIIEKGINDLGIYHLDKVLYIKKDEIRTNNLKLLFYYHNRLEGYEIS